MILKLNPFMENYYAHDHPNDPVPGEDPVDPANNP